MPVLCGLSTELAGLLPPCFTRPLYCIDRIMQCNVPTDVTATKYDKDMAEVARKEYIELKKMPVLLAAFAAIVMAKVSSKSSDH